MGYAPSGNGFFLIIFKTTLYPTSFFLQTWLIIWTIYLVRKVQMLLLATSESFSPPHLPNFSEDIFLSCSHAADVAHDADEHAHHKDNKDCRCDFDDSASGKYEFDLVRVLVLGLTRNRHLV